MSSVCKGIPRLTVAMTVRNLAPHVAVSVESILAQSYTDFEFVIRDDGSDDGTGAILRRFAERDPRIRLFEEDENLGPSGSSNWIAAQARGELIARMDGDDWSHPDRLRRQLAVLDSTPEAVLVGSLGETVDETGRVVRPRERWRLLGDSPFAPFPHGSIMFRRDAFDRAGGYRAAAEFWEDLDLYRRLSAHGALLVIVDPLYRHRATRLSTRLVSDRGEVETSVDRMYRAVSPAMKPPRRGRIAPRVFLSLGSTTLWAGGRPRVLRSLLKRGDVAADLESLAILAWGLWALISPGTLRTCLRWAGQLRDAVAARRLPEGGFVRWDGGRSHSYDARPRSAEPVALERGRAPRAQATSPAADGPAGAGGRPLPAQAQPQLPLAETRSG